MPPPACAAPIVERLAARFAGQLDRRIIEAVVASYAAQFAEPRSPDYLVVVERASAAALQCRADCQTRATATA